MKPWDWLTAGFKGLLSMMREADGHGHQPSAENRELIRSYLDEIRLLTEDSAEPPAGAESHLAG
jgi:hypothetical protein